MSPRSDDPADDPARLARTPEGEVCLVGRIAGGDRVAFEALYRAYFPRLGRFLQRMTRSPHLIEEIVNDTLRKRLIARRRGTRCCRKPAATLKAMVRRIVS